MIRGMVSAAASRRSFAVDPNVRLLLHFDGGFTDSSSYARGVTVGGNPTASDPVARFGTSALFDGSGDVLTLAADPMLDIPAVADWTLELSVRFSAIGTTVIYQHAVGSGNYPLQLLLNSGGKLQVRGFNSADNTAYDIEDSVSAATDVWYVLGVRRSGSTVSFWKNGTQIGSVAFGGTLYGANLPVAIGAYPNGTFGLNGRIDELRLSVGVARDLSVVPSAPF